MTKPIGYYCAVTPGDGTFLDHLQNQYGSTFEKLTKLQKLYILTSLVGNLTNAEIEKAGSYSSTEDINAITNLIAQIRQHLPMGEHLSLADAVINQLKYQK
ncbi:hypothetical protein [Nostoc sp. C110]|uniref:hypothetical protein n=1 Tax=Nostoc sp. C110 TaxID=3349876 RepID=UPI00370D2B68